MTENNTIKGLMAEIKYAATQLEKDCKDLHKPFAGMIDTEENYDALQENRPPVMETDAEVRAWEVENERNKDHAYGG